MTKFPIQRDDETLIGGVSIDITPRIEATEALKRVREELIRQERLGSIAQLSSVLAHDLNNTLNAISLRLWALNSDPEFAKRNHTDKLLGLVDRAASSVARLQTFVRAHREPQLERLDLARLIRKAIESVRSDLEPRTFASTFRKCPRICPRYWVSPPTCIRFSPTYSATRTTRCPMAAASK